MRFGGARALTLACICRMVDFPGEAALCAHRRVKDLRTSSGCDADSNEVDAISRKFLHRNEEERKCHFEEIASFGICFEWRIPHLVNTALGEYLICQIIHLENTSFIKYSTTRSLRLVKSSFGEKFDCYIRHSLISSLAEYVIWSTKMRAAR